MSLTRAELLDVHLHERREFVEFLRSLGPDAPTLCPPWRTSTMASHVVVAEQVAGTGWALGWPARRIAGPARAIAVRRRLEPVMLWSMARAERRGWDWLLERLRKGPPRLFGIPTLARVRLMEDWIHHEDVRRANGLDPRPTDERLDAALVDGFERMAEMPEFARARSHIAVHLRDGRTINDSDQTAIVLSGPPGEVLLALAGRAHVAAATVDGDASLLGVEALRF